MRILVADDDRTTVARLAHLLGRWGLEVQTVPDGTQAYDALQADPTISLAIFDWMMPGIDGLGLCRRIRRDETRAHMYVILLTGRDSRTDLVAGLDAGADDYLVKPFDAEELRARVQAGCRVLALQQRLSERVAELQAALSNVKRLQGLLPICSYCKKVRSDQNYWQQVEQYVGQHTDVKFSHSICPSCYEIAIKELDDET